MKRSWSLLLLISILCVSDADARTRKQNTRSRAAAPKVIDIAAVNDPNAAKAAPDAGILRAQILLDRANFSPGEIDGKPGDNFTRAISGFQEARSLPTTGNLDDPTWEALNADSAAAVVPYRLTEADVAGPFTEIPKDLIEQSKLEELGFSSAEEALGEQFH